MITMRVTTESRDADDDWSSETIEMATDQPWDPTVARDIRDTILKLITDRYVEAAELAEAEAADELEWEEGDE